MMKLHVCLFLCLIFLFGITACAVGTGTGFELAPATPVVSPQENITFTPVPPTSTFSPTFTSIPGPTFTPSPMPTQFPFPNITPNAEQLSKWREYEDALAARLLSRDYLLGGKIICEWKLLGAEPGKLFAWARCTQTTPIDESEFYSSSDVPVVILIDESNNVLEILKPGAGSLYAKDIREFFPPDVQERIFSHQIDFSRMSEHLDYRRDHPEESPLIVKDMTPSPSSN